MVLNLADRFTNKADVRNDALVNFIRRMDVEVLGHGFRLQQGVERLDNFMLPNFLLIYFLNGAGLLQHGRQTTEIRPGSVYILNPFELYNGIRVSPEPMDYMYIYFDLHPVSNRGIFQRYVFESGDEFFQRPWSQRLIPALDELRLLDPTERFQQDFLLQHTIRNLVGYVLFERLKGRANAYLFSTSRESGLVNQSFSYVERHLNEPLDIGALVKELGTSRSSLNRVFMKIVQNPPLKALTRFKMRLSLDLLKSGQSVKQTAKAVGYTSAFHFSRTFKMVMGRSPTDYLKL